MAKSARNPKPKKNPRAKSNSRKGLFPNQYQRRSPVYVERLRGVDETQRYGEDDLYTTDVYNVITTRTDGQWSYTMELKGVIFPMPGAVFDRIVEQRKAIIKEQRTVSAQRTAEARKAKRLALANQVEASQEDAEREADLRGL